MRILRTSALAVTLSVVVQALKPFGIQSGGAGFYGSSYASAMSYDAERDLVFVTGSTYSPFFDLKETTSSPSLTSGCFLSILSLPTANTAGDSDFIYKERFGTSDVVESCSSLTRVDSKIYIGGQAEEGGLLTSLRPVGSDESVQYGIVLDVAVDVQFDKYTASTLLGGRLLHKSNVESVRAMVRSSTGDSIFVVSQISDIKGTTPDFDQSDSEPNLVDQPKWGEDFKLNVIMFNHREGQPSTGSNPATTFDGESWNTVIGINQNPVDVAGITLFSTSNVLLVAGSAIGNNDDSIPITNTDSWAGFVTLLNADSGKVIKSLRIDTIDTKYTVTTRVEGICRHPDREDEIYLVGSTDGDIDESGDDPEQQALTAFLMRLSVLDLDLEMSWVQQMNAIPGPLSMASASAEMVGLACAVTDDGVYVGGVVVDGAVVNDERHSSAGMDDIWIGFVDSTTEDLVWTRQIGTPDNEHLSALEVDKNGDVLVLGNSNGSFMRRKTDGDLSTDIFLMRLTKLDGEFPVPQSDIDIPISDDTINEQPSPSTPSDSPNAPAFAPNLAIPETSSSDNGGGSNAGVVAVVIVISAILVVVGCFIFKRRHKDHHAETDSSHIERYVGGFDDVEVDLKHSATGGWHGTYVNHDGGPRYFSDDGMPDDDCITFSRGEMSALTHSAIVKESLFSLDDEEPELGGGAVALGDFRSRQSSYRGLVDVYNNYDLSHHRLPSHQQRSVRPRAMVDVDIDEEEEGLYNSRWGREII